MERLTKGIGVLSLETSEGYRSKEDFEENSDDISPRQRVPDDLIKETTEEMLSQRESMTNNQSVERPLPSSVLPLLRYYQYESSDSSARYNSVILFVVSYCMIISPMYRES